MMVFSFFAITEESFHIIQRSLRSSRIPKTHRILRNSMQSLVIPRSSLGWQLHWDIALRHLVFLFPFVTHSCLNIYFPKVFKSCQFFKCERKWPAPFCSNFKRISQLYQHLCTKIYCCKFCHFCEFNLNNYSTITYICLIWLKQVSLSTLK